MIISWTRCTLLSCCAWVAIGNTCSAGVVAQIKLRGTGSTNSSRSAFSAIVWTIFTLWALSIVKLARWTCHTCFLSIIPMIISWTRCTLLSCCAFFTIGNTCSAGVVTQIKLSITNLTNCSRSARIAIFTTVSAFWSLTVKILACSTCHTFFLSIIPMIISWTRCTLLSCCAWVAIGNTCSAGVVTQIKLRGTGSTNSSRSAFSAIAWTIFALWTLSIVKLARWTCHTCFLSIIPMIISWTRCTLLSCCAWVAIGNTCSAGVVTQIKLRGTGSTNSSRSAFSAITRTIFALWALSIVKLARWTCHTCFLSVIPMIISWTRCTLLSCCAWVAIGNTCSASVVTQIKLRSTGSTNSSRSAFSAIAWTIFTLWALSIVKLARWTCHTWFLSVIPMIISWTRCTLLAAVHSSQLATHAAQALSLK